eukprot:COSAG02_NODE_524_length_20723_cov_79.399438_11_plen_145_part_00
MVSSRRVATHVATTVPPRQRNTTLGACRLGGLTRARARAPADGPARARAIEGHPARDAARSSRGIVRRTEIAATERGREQLSGVYTLDGQPAKGIAGRTRLIDDTTNDVGGDGRKFRAARRRCGAPCGTCSQRILCSGADRTQR